MAAVGGGGQLKATAAKIAEVVGGDAADGLERAASTAESGVDKSVAGAAAHMANQDAEAVAAGNIGKGAAGAADATGAAATSGLTPKELVGQYDRGSLYDQPSFINDLRGVLPEGMTDQQAMKLATTPAHELSADEQALVVQMRNSIPNRKGSLQTKVLTDESAEDYMGDIGYSTTVAGSTARAADTAPLAKPVDGKNYLGLNDSTSPVPWTPVPDGANHVYQMRWRLQNADDMQPAFGAHAGLPATANRMATLGGRSEPVTLDPPFLGTGFTSGGIPEYKSVNPQSLGSRAEMWKLDTHGNEQLAAVYVEGKGWTKV
jgi:hypothetical protein